MEWEGQEKVEAFGILEVLIKKSQFIQSTGKQGK